MLRRKGKIEKLVILTLTIILGPTNGSEWYHELPPGITRAEISGIAGKPTSRTKSIDKYDLEQGHLELKYNDDVLTDCSHIDPGKGAISRSIYHTWGGDLKETHLKKRRAYIKKGSFLILPDFEGQKIRSPLYNGICYMLDDGFVVVDSIVEFTPGMGHFDDKVAKLTLVDSKGHAKVLYRAADHWKKLKPPKLSWTEVEKRTANLRALGERSIEMPFNKIFGREFTQMGSGLDYRLFYLKDALAIVRVVGETGETNSGKIFNIWIERPGVESLSLKAWTSASEVEKNKQK